MQETEQWRLNRLARFTSSSIGKLLTGGSRPMTEQELATREKGVKRSTVDVEFGDTAITYIKEVLKEAMTGISKPGPTTWAMQWGIDNEPIAAMRYAELYPDLVYYGSNDPKFFDWNEPDFEIWAGGSPDGLTDLRVVEIKCPDTNFMDYLWISKGYIFGSETPYKGTYNDWLKWYDKDYYCQVQFNMVVCEKKKAHFVVFDPRMSEPDQQLVILEIKEDPEYQELIKSKIKKAVDIVLKQLEILNQ